MLFLAKADLDFQGNDLKMTHISNVHGCAFCPASKHADDLPWYHMVKDMAGWIVNAFTTESWKMARPGQGVEVFRMSFMSCLSLGVDMMHVKHLGVDKPFFGSILWLLCFEVLNDGPQSNLDYVFGLIEQYYRDHNYSSRRLSTYKCLKFGMFTNAKYPHASYPVLKGKAAEIHHLGPALLWVWENHIVGVAEDAATNLVSKLMGQRHAWTRTHKLASNSARAKCVVHVSCVRCVCIYIFETRSLYLWQAVFAFINCGCVHLFPSTGVSRNHCGISGMRANGSHYN
jgi:hypothetical protein